MKNAIIIGSVRDGVEFTADEYAETASKVLLELAEQAVATGRHFAEASSIARSSGGRGQHVHDYRRVDVRNLTHKEAVQLAVAHELRHRASDPVVLRDLVLRARAAAWEEVAAAIVHRSESADTGLSFRQDGEYPKRLAALQEEVRSLEQRGFRPIGRLSA